MRVKKQSPDPLARMHTMTGGVRYLPQISIIVARLHLRRAGSGLHDSSAAGAGADLRSRGAGKQVTAARSTLVDSEGLPNSGESANFRFLVTIICLSGNSPAGSRR